MKQIVWKVILYDDEGRISTVWAHSDMAFALKQRKMLLSLGYYAKITADIEGVKVFGGVR